ncbi:hypothetical protein [Aquidulcibacter sp.]|uniref:hypothetical protein n=1 Tax=Aquidulcibacter sp. TaxID=2052990 RepID=UPI0025BF3780|nr:hypothetical protein [Aquidulcibacter sp.]MCA3064016.1 hypothetical protein [Rhodocyclaceae bacterium]MCA3694228.1 hypothetical protein [Aquidulcibacter sp.]
MSLTDELTDYNKAVLPFPTRLKVAVELERLTTELAAYKKDAEWQPTESMPEGWGSQNFVERLGDMSPLGRLRVAFDNDGDVIVAIVPDPNSYDTGGSVEFCTTGFGGGGSPHTRNACIALFKAMERDNESNRARCGLIGRGAAITAAIAEQEPNK